MTVDTRPWGVAQAGATKVKAHTGADVTLVETLTTGREAFNRHAWEEAVQALTAADRQEPLSPADLELLAEAEWWSGHPDESGDTLERAYARYVEAGLPTAAAEVAVLLAYRAMRRLALSVAGGWIARAERLLENEPESGVHAYLKLLELVEALLFRDDLEAAIGLADEVLELARKHGRRDAGTQALGFKGYALVAGGQWPEGMALIDEATAAAVSGEVGLRASCDVYCNTIAACRNMADFRRAGEWTEEAERWMSRNSVGGYPGVCRVHRAELKRLHGAWPEAEQEALEACDELERYHILDGVGFAHYEIGEVHLRMGDLAGAEEAFLRAHEFGHESQPGLALLMLAKGQADEAAKALAPGLSEGTGKQGERKDLLHRARLLPAQVEVALARSDVKTARAASFELEQIASEFPRPAFEAAALTARGAVALHEGDADSAVSALQRAWRLWRDIGFPYEAARARTLLGKAHAAADDEGAARMEWGAARSIFSRLGAALDLKQVEELLYEGRPTTERDRVTKTFIFTDIVTSTDLVGLIGDAAWEELLRWHDRELRSAFLGHRGEVVSHTGDGFFVAFDRAADAIEAAVTIQRRLADHRREHGFAPWVRIGVHRAEATREGADYRGQGVHTAARVGSVGGAEEIVVSEPTLEEAGEIRYPVSEPRTVEMKGIKAPVAVHTIDWR